VKLYKRTAPGDRLHAETRGELTVNRLCVCILFFTFAVVTAHAEETNEPAPISTTSNAVPSVVTSNALPAFITIDGITYSNVTWRTVTAATVTIFHSTGIAAIPLEKLPPELRKQFGYNPQKAAAWQATEQNAAASRADAQRRQALLKKYASQYLFNRWEVGAIGKLGGGWMVLQVRDANSVLLHQRIENYYGKIVGWSVPVCLQGVPTSGYVDGQNLRENTSEGMVLKVTGTMHDEDVGTIFVLEPYDGK
jgi:hypothetical protein